ncbi:oxidoreductase C-terminal domain-containing protein [Candidatus Burkholderia verschuerenii]|uniref:oxidoreductase C-terminal domain-containing protein n=1 Tax=Candidatus Burkholderia verschuerenii TaxID=242163 RepID=UPI001E479E4C|nr:oxidoreductase C-terminal domain-containing protein [Candidatus Burkholderia verschuerenii]
MDFYFDAHDALVGASGFGLASGIAKDMKLARMLIERGASPDADQLADPTTKLKSLL